MRHQKRKPDDFPGSLAEHFVYSNEISLGFGHLDAGDGQHAVVQPIMGEVAVAVGANALGDLVLVVWKDQIEAPAVDVESLAELGFAHRRAFNVPARSTAPPRTVPSWRVCIRRLP